MRITEDRNQIEIARSTSHSFNPCSSIERWATWRSLLWAWSVWRSQQGWSDPGPSSPGWHPRVDLQLYITVHYQIPLNPFFFSSRGQIWPSTSLSFIKMTCVGFLHNHSCTSWKPNHFYQSNNCLKYKAVKRSCSFLGHLRAECFWAPEGWFGLHRERMFHLFSEQYII